MHQSESLNGSFSFRHQEVMVGGDPEAKVCGLEVAGCWSTVSRGMR